MIIVNDDASGASWGEVLFLFLFHMTILCVYKKYCHPMHMQSLQWCVCA
jgi:hypothetical protein